MNTQDIVFSVNCYISGILSISLSLALLYAIIYHTPIEMRNYRIFILNVNISDLLVSTFMTVLQWVPASSKKEIERPSNDSGISYLIKGPVVFFIHPHYNHMLTCIFMGIFLYNILTLPTSFAFRYISLANQYLIDQLTQKKILIPFFAFLFLLVCSVFVTMYLGDMPKEGASAEVLTFSEYYAHKEETNETRFGNLIHLNFMVYYSLLIVGVFIFIGYIILIYSGIQIFRLLKKSKQHLTARTLELHKLLAVTLAFQSCLPLIFVLLPLLTIVISIWTNNYSETVNSIAMLFFSYQVVLSPIFTFTFVKPYRIALFNRVLRVQTIKKLIVSFISINHTVEVAPAGAAAHGLPPCPRQPSATIARQPAILVRPATPQKRISLS